MGKYKNKNFKNKKHFLKKKCFKFTSLNLHL